MAAPPGIGNAWPVAGCGTYSAANRSARSAGTQKSVSVMPSGSKIRSFMNTSSGWPRRDLDDAAEHVGRHAVVPLAARLEHERQLGPLRAAIGEIEPGRVAPRETGVAVQRVDGVGVVESVGEPGGVGEQVPDPDRLGLRFEHRAHERARSVHRRVGELGDERADRLLQGERALLVQHHRGDRRDRLAHREHPHDRVVLERQSCLDVALAVGRRVDDLTTSADHGVPAGQPAVVDVLREVRVDPATAGRRRSRGRTDRRRRRGSVVRSVIAPSIAVAGLRSRNERCMPPPPPGTIDPSVPAGMAAPPAPAIRRRLPRSFAPSAAVAVADSGPVGTPRSAGLIILLTIVTFGIWTLVWSYQNGNELKNARQDRHRRRRLPASSPCSSRR